MPVAPLHRDNLILAILSLPAEPNASDLEVMIAHAARAARKTVCHAQATRHGDNSGDLLLARFPDAVQREVVLRPGNA
jgi:hypothetical protein